MAYSPPFSLPRGRLLFVLLLVGACDGPLPDLSNSSGLASAAPLDAQALELTRADTTFAALVERLSESGGYFDTDNLISNESSYLHVMGALREVDVRGGAYIGVGPDQNFSYIARVRPSIAFIIGIRRDNLLEHLFFGRDRVDLLTVFFLDGDVPLVVQHLKRGIYRAGAGVTRLAQNRTGGKKKPPEGE
jgi:hypothetical protein